MDRIFQKGFAISYSVLFIGKSLGIHFKYVKNIVGLTPTEYGFLKTSGSDTHEADSLSGYKPTFRPSQKVNSRDEKQILSIPDTQFVEMRFTPETD